MPVEPVFAGDPIPPTCKVIEVRVAELRQLFNAIDPSPFRERDLDPRAEEFIVDWSRDLPSDAPLALVVHLERAAGRPDEAVILREAIHEFFAQRAASSRRNLRQLFRRGRISLVIGLAFLASSTAIGDALASYFQDSRWAAILQESLLIGGWVVMWRPREVCLYDWRPIREEARLSDRLSAMPVKIVYEAETTSDAWRSDWPAVPARDQSSTARRPLQSEGSDTIVTGAPHDIRRDEPASAHGRRRTKDPGRVLSRPRHGQTRRLRTLGPRVPNSLLARERRRDQRPTVVLFE